jgi:hypothetical protein
MVYSLKVFLFYLLVALSVLKIFITFHLKTINSRAQNRLQLILPGPASYVFDRENYFYRYDFNLHFENKNEVVLVNRSLLDKISLAPWTSQLAFGHALGKVRNRMSLNAIGYFVCKNKIASIVDVKSFSVSTRFETINHDLKFLEESEKVVCSEM